MLPTIGKLGSPPQLSPGSSLLAPISGGSAPNSMPSTPKRGNSGNVSGGVGAGPSLFQQQRDIALKKQRMQFETRCDEYDIDLRASHAKASAEPAMLARQFSLGAEEAGNEVDQLVQQLSSRISQLRNGYQALAKEAQRKHMEAQQRRAAGSKAADLPTIVAPPSTPIAAAPRQQELAPAPCTPTTRPPLPPREPLRAPSPAPPAATPSPSSSASSSSPPAAAGAGAPASDFGRLEAMHGKFLARAQSTHEHSILSRQAEVGTPTERGRGRGGRGEVGGGGRGRAGTGGRGLLTWGRGS